MKTLILITALILFSCSDEEPCLSCSQMRQVSKDAYQSWQTLKAVELPTMQELEQRQVKKAEYLKAEAWIGGNCYNHDYRTDY